MSRLLITIGFALYVMVSVTAQAEFRIGYLPDLVVSAKVAANWTIVGATETRIGSSAVEWRDLGRQTTGYQLTDVSLIASRKTGLYSKVAAGYLLRWQDAVVHRLVQQYTVVTPFQGWRFAHRIASDQTWRPEEDVEVRLRYRIAFDRPLQGESVDRGEFYCKFGSEYLTSIQSTEIDLEIRVVPALGFVISDKQKIEFALDYRLSNFTRSSGRHTLWTKINAYLSF